MHRKSLRKHLTAWEEYKEPKDRKGSASREETSFKVAWAAVKKSYHKDQSGNWMKDGD